MTLADAARVLHDLVLVDGFTMMEGLGAITRVIDCPNTEELPALCARSLSHPEDCDVPGCVDGKLRVIV